MKVTLDAHIEVTPGVRGGRPRIAGRRITVDDIVIMHRRLGQSVDEVVAKYDTSPSRAAGPASTSPPQTS